MSGSAVEIRGAAPETPAKRQRRRQICAVAGRLFYERGYSQVTLKDVGDELGFTAPAIYRHFAGKQDLLRATIADGLDTVEETVTASDGDLDLLVQNLADAAVARADIWEVVHRESRHLEHDDREHIRHRLKAVGNAIGKAIAARRPDVTPQTANLLARSVLAALSAPSAYPLAAPSKQVAANLAAIAHSVAHMNPAVVDGRLEVVQAKLPHRPTRSRREDVLAEAARLFSRRGFDEVGMSDIGEAVGLTGPSIYHYFDSKAEILISIFRRGLERLALNESQASAHDAGDSELAFVEAYTRLALDHPELFLLFVHERFTLVQNDDGSVLRSYRDFIDRWVAVVRHNRPEIRIAQARLLVSCVMSIIGDLAITSDGSPDRDDAIRLGSLALVLLKSAG